MSLAKSNKNIETPTIGETAHRARPFAILAAGLVIVSVGLEREFPPREDPSGVVVINSHIGVNRTATNDLQAVLSGTMTPARHSSRRLAGDFSYRG